MKLHLLAVVLVGSSAALRPTRAQVASIDHCPPQLGAPFVIELGGAPPGASVRLFFSPEAANRPTPFGTLELARDGLTLLAHGIADAEGFFRWSTQIPLEPSLAERWGHYQAALRDPAAPGGWRLSEAAHVRYLGPRLYETCVGGSWSGRPEPAQLFVLSPMNATTIAIVPLAPSSLPFVGAGADEGEPVFTRDLAFGAVAPASDRLVIFDNFALEARAWMGLQDASMRLVRALDGRGVVVLEAGAGRISWIDLESATITATLALPKPVTSLWSATPDATEAWIAEVSSGQPRPTLRRVDLVARQVREAVAVGAPEGGTLHEVRAAANVILAVTDRNPPWSWQTDSSVSAVDRSTSPASVQTAQLPATIITTIQPLHRLGLLALATHWSGGPGSGSALLSSLAAPLAWWGLAQPPSYYLGNDIEYAEFEEDETGFWVMHPCCDWDGGPSALMYYSLQSGQWSEFADYSSSGPFAMALSRDSLTYAVSIARNGVYCTTCPGPDILLFDVATQTFTALPGGWGPIALYALSLR